MTSYKLWHLRGRTLDKAFVILDGLTRMGKTAKLGRSFSSRYSKKQFSGLAYALKCLGEIPEIKIIKLDQSDN